MTLHVIQVPCTVVRTVFSYVVLVFVSKLHPKERGLKFCFKCMIAPCKTVEDFFCSAVVYVKRGGEWWKEPKSHSDHTNQNETKIVYLSRRSVANLSREMFIVMTYFIILFLSYLPSFGPHPSRKTEKNYHPESCEFSHHIKFGFFFPHSGVTLNVDD